MHVELTALTVTDVITGWHGNPRDDIQAVATFSGEVNKFKQWVKQIERQFSPYWII